MPFFSRKKKTNPTVDAATVTPTMPSEDESATPANAPRQVQEIVLKQIVPNRQQPRKQFSNESISELADTIAAHGLLQPIVLRQYEPDHYEIIAGERRFRAVQALGWRKIPAIIDQMDEQESAEMAVIENLQREDLNPVDEARAYQNLLQNSELTQGQLADRVGKSQSYIANKLRLLRLPDEALQALVNGKISARHGRALLKLDATTQAIVLKQILTDNLTVTQTDALIKRLSQTPTTATSETGADAKPKAKAKPQRQHVGNPDLRLAKNTLKKSIQLIEASGAQVEVQDQLANDVYQISITVHVTEAPTAAKPSSAPKEEN
ncbi:ParB/RepB/Spo0J family partition protein [Lapidilactobacillus wuchangensis]|uniref:ParB/RepB/Spo0J family partition protein n=1 Tax=Lapidilactobacillus wuchangensis TaxID=2486001 RepID=UPI002989DEAA|nr:ParB/RepB/Spo0J family partition protein [Lapidilactobacillus wuchangensis]